MLFKVIEWENNAVKIIDQTKLPNEFKYIYLKDVDSLWTAIKKLKVRGAPALGVAAAFGVVLGVLKIKAKNHKDFMRQLDKIISKLKSARPTAVNLFWALERMREKAIETEFEPLSIKKKILLKQANKILEEDKQVCRKIGENGQAFIKSGDRIMTICNAGALATSEYGTALAVIYVAKDKRKKVKVYACETRPLLQGARLTTWELMKNKVDVTLICDNMAATVIKQGMVDKIITGADRIALNGDTANKIGTYDLAVLAKYHKIPFYVAAPVSSFDFSIKTGNQIPIEERDKFEIIRSFGKYIAPKNCKAYNPVFDVTPNELITAIITEKGVVRLPFSKNIAKLK